MTIYAGDECSQRLNLDSHRVLRGAVFNFEVGVDGQNGFGLCVAQVAKDRRCVRYGRFEGGIFHDRGKSAEMWAGSEGRSTEFLGNESYCPSALHHLYLFSVLTKVNTHVNLFIWPDP